MELPIVSALEFDQVRNSISNYIKTKTDFQDYDFEGSNLSMIIDILSYNTLYTTYNLNMSVNELSLDTAVLRDNVVSIAKQLGYRASSYTSSKLLFDLTVDNSDLEYDFIRVKKGSVLTASQDTERYTFILRKDIEITSTGKSQITFSDIESVEGSEFGITYIVDSSNEHQRFFIPNNFIDSDTIRVFVITDPTNNVEREYVRKDTIVNVSGSDEVFFVEEVQDQKYEIIFGDDVIGRKVRNGELIRIEFVVTNGSKANSIKSGLKFVGQLEGKKVTDADFSSIQYGKITWKLKSEFSDGGSEFEDIRSIKYRAPRYYASQGRAVTISDYESLVQQIYGNAKLVKVIGGEDFTPPQFGKIYLIIEPDVGKVVSDQEKERIKAELSQYQVGSLDLQIRDAGRLSMFAKPIILFDKSKTANRESDLLSLANKEINDYTNDIEFNQFGGFYSDLKLRSRIQNLDDAIDYVKVPIYLSKPVDLVNGIETQYAVDFNTSLDHFSDDPYYVISDAFCVKDVNTPVFLAAPSNCSDDDNLYLYTIDGRLLDVVGKVDYETGNVSWELRACQEGPINIIVRPDVPDILAPPTDVPELILLPPIIDPTPEDPIKIGEILDPDNPVMPPVTIPPGTVGDGPGLGDGGDLTTDPGDPGDGDGGGAPGDNDGVITPPGGVILLPGPGGGVPIIPTIPGGGEIEPPEETDPNDIINIDDFVPETNPYSCS